MRRPGAVQMAALLAALLLSTGLVLRISATLNPMTPETRSDTAATNALVLRDGVSGQTLFEGEHLAPGEVLDRCISVRATGTRTPDRITLTADSQVDPMLAPWLQLHISRGPDIGDGRPCHDYEERTLVADGPADAVLASLDRGVAWAPDEAEAIPSGHATTYRIRATLLPDAPNDVQGTSMAFDLLWESPYAAAGDTLFSRSLALVLRFTEDSMLPMLLILALAIMFLGIQDRLDTATPRLNSAALFDEVVEFGVLEDAWDAGVRTTLGQQPTPETQRGQQRRPAKATQRG